MRVRACVCACFFLYARLWLFTNDWFVKKMTMMTTIMIMIAMTMAMTMKKVMMMFDPRCAKYDLLTMMQRFLVKTLNLIPLVKEQVE